MQFPLLGTWLGVLVNKDEFCTVSGDSYDWVTIGPLGDGSVCSLSLVNNWVCRCGDRSLMVLFINCLLVWC